MTVLCPMLIEKNGGIMSGPPPNNGYYVALIIMSSTVNESTAEWSTRDCYVSLLAASPPFSSIKLLRNRPIFLSNVSKTKFTNIII
jgi:hypothetical protein